ncbi:MAG TPA: hypothetical protein VGJ84_20135 [Polyangiaceae bacterium]
MSKLVGLGVFLILVELAVLVAVRVLDFPPPSMAGVQYICRGSNDLLTCSFTNTGERVDGRICVTGKLVPQKGEKNLESAPICTGRIGPKETRTISAPWARGSAADVCFKLDEHAGKQLDMDSCTLKMRTQM